MGLLMNIVLSVVGASIGSAIFSFFGIALGGWLGYLISGFIGARSADLDRPSDAVAHRLTAIKAPLGSSRAQVLHCREICSLA